MEAQDRLLEEITLENGLTVQFSDCSKPVAGDRCQVQLLVTIPLPVNASWFEHDDASIEDLPEFLNAHGGKIDYRQTKIRNFIDRKALASTLDTMKADFLTANAMYLSHPSFARKYVLLKYHAWKQEFKCARLHEEAILKAECGSED